MSKKEPSPELIKIVLVGGARVGKTNLISKFIKDEFNPSYLPTIGIISARKLI